MTADESPAAVTVRVAPPYAATLREQAEALRQQVLDLRSVLEERDEELAAAREANRKLMAQLNSARP